MRINSVARKAKHLGIFICAVSVAATSVQPAFAFSNSKLVNSRFAPAATIISAKKINSTSIEILYSDNSRMTIDFYGDNIFRLFQDNKGGPIRNPEAKPAADILVNNPRKAVNNLTLTDGDKLITINSAKVSLTIDKQTLLFKLVDLKTNKVSAIFTKPIAFEKDKVTLTLKEDANEYFYGGGVQNGRFSHKGKAIAIENQNSWTDGGVASPTPYYWSTNGYAVMWHTFKKGKYDFGAKEKGTVKLYHEDDYLDVFFMVNDGAVPLLNDFYQLTGNPVLLPKFGFYQGHLNAYNRDFWSPDEKGILFEDGKRYRESQKDNGGVKESLNGGKNNYQFSARAVIDRYQNANMPFGWILPNDGYGAGYGQTETLDGNIANLKSLGDYARKKGVEIGLWTQSDLHPKEGISALLQRDIVKEVRDAGVRVLKTDVAWVGAGYSFGLNGVADASQIMTKYGQNSRPFIISLDGWAGTQRYATIWSGDQTGGQWEYIRFHIPTYIGSGLSGQPNITSDVDGIFGGKNTAVNTRDFQWKTFTPMQLNMDGWGANEKYPQALGEPFTSINRNYLKFKSALMPYAYSVAKEAVNGLPIMRAMFLSNPNAYTLGAATQYQYLFGPNLLVAPIYQATKIDAQGNDIRNGIYLPEGTWFDYFTGEKFEGNRVINNFDSPIWKTPLFAKAGAIIPLANANNNVSEINKGLRIYEVYPYGESTFATFDDDGTTEAYKAGKGVVTNISSNLDTKGNLVFNVKPSTGSFDGFTSDVATTIKINVSEKPKRVTAKIGKSKVKLTEAKTAADFENATNAYYYEAAPNFNQFSTAGTEFEKVKITRNPQLLVKVGKTDITKNELTVNVTGVKLTQASTLLNNTGALQAPIAQVTENDRGSYNLSPSWKKVAQADFYEISYNDMLYSTIKDTTLLFDALTPETNYDFKVRAVNKTGVSAWTAITAKTKSNPLEFAIKNMSAETSVPNQGGESANKLVDFDENSMWHTAYGAKAVPFDLVIDLKSLNKLDKMQYLPRLGAGNGAILAGTIAYSEDKQTWNGTKDFNWERNDKTKEISFAGNPKARYVKLSVTKAVGDYGSGRELYVYKVPGSESVFVGDINNDQIIDMNDFTSYLNYTGLRKGDGDFEGYISNGDINKNGLIDAYDISVVATQLENGAKPSKDERVAGALTISANKSSFVKDEIVEINVKGNKLKDVNALSFALPYDAQDYEFVGIQKVGVAKMENMTYDRLHTNRTKALYPTFVNIGNEQTLKGSDVLFTIKLKAKRNVKFNLKPIDGLLIDKNLNSVKF